MAGQKNETKLKLLRNIEEFILVEKETMIWRLHLIFQVMKVALLCISVCVSKFQATLSY